MFLQKSLKPFLSSGSLIFPWIGKYAKPLQEYLFHPLPEPGCLILRQ